MRSSVALSDTPVLVRLLALATTLVLALAPASLGPPPSSFPPTARTGVAVGTAPDAVVGAVPFGTRLGRFGCLACAGVMIGIGGTSLLGAAVTAAAWPNYAAWCALGCYQAFR